MRCSCYVLAMAVLVGGVAARGGDYPMFGGTGGRNMVSGEKDLPEVLTEAGTKTPVHLAWSAGLGSKSYGNPTVAGGRVFLGTNNTPARDGRYGGDRGVVMCLEEGTGRSEWTLAVPRFADGHYNFYISGLGICSSPTVEGEKVYVVSNRDELLCLSASGMAEGGAGHFANLADFLKMPVIKEKASTTKKAGAAKAGGEKEPATQGAGEAAAGPGATGPAPKGTGDILWCYDFIKQADVAPHDATDCSPLVVGDTVWVVTAAGVNKDHKVSDRPEAPTLMVFDKRTGRALAQDGCGINRKVFHCNWSSPTLGAVGGKAAVFLGAGDGFLYAFDAAVSKDGKEGGELATLKVLWSVDANPVERRKDAYKTKAGPSEIISMPVYENGRVYVMVGQDPTHGKGLGNLVCVEANSGKVLWNDATVQRSISTVAVSNGLLFAADISGTVYCYEAGTGKRLWEEATGDPIWGSPLVADGKVYVGNTGGKVFVFGAEGVKKVVSENRFPASVQSTLVAANGKLYVMTVNMLYAFSNGGGARGAAGAIVPAAGR